MGRIEEGLIFSKDHEWVRDDGGVFIIGISDYAQDQLGEILYVELPSEGDEIVRNTPFGSVESSKSVSDLFAPVNGEVLEVNKPVLESPETINADPYGDGWLIKVKPSDPKEADTLMNAESYFNYVEEEF